MLGGVATKSRGLFPSEEPNGLTNDLLRPTRGVWANKSLLNAFKTLLELY